MSETYLDVPDGFIESIKSICTDFLYERLDEKTARRFNEKLNQFFQQENLPYSATTTYNYAGVKSLVKKEKTPYFEISLTSGGVSVHWYEVVF